MKKQTADMIRNYVRKLSESELMWLHHRLIARLGNDLAESIKVMSKSPEMDRWFFTSTSAIELYDMVDIVQQYVERDNRLAVSSRR